MSTTNSKNIKQFNNFDESNQIDESLFSGENEEPLSANNAFSEEEETSFEAGVLAFDDEDDTFDDNELTSDNEMEDSNSDAIDDEIQYAGGSETTNTDSGFNPNFSRTPQEWSIVKFMSDAGMRIGMDYSNEVDQGVEVVKNGLDYETCCSEIDALSSELGIDQFDNMGGEKYIGGLHKSMIKKNIETPKTSYGE